jgi:hypothetical protein
VSDNAQCFTSREFKQFCFELGVKHVTTSGVWPTMLQSAKRGASSLPFFPSLIPPPKTLLLQSAEVSVTVTYASPPHHPFLLQYIQLKSSRVIAFRSPSPFIDLKKACS